MTTAALILALIAAAFVFGFLLADRRAVRQCNAILDEHWQDLMKAIRDDRDGFPSDAEDEDDRPTVH